jgi:hypothetical protein
MQYKKSKKTMEEHCKKCQVFTGEIPPPKLGCYRYPPSYCMNYLMPGKCFENSGIKQEIKHEIKIQSEKAQS